VGAEVTTDLAEISKKLNLAVTRLQTFDRQAHEAAHQDIVEAAFWLSILLEESPVTQAVGQLLKEPTDG